MWLLNVQDPQHIYLQKFQDRNTPPYAILSHTWSTDGEQELLFRDLQSDLSPGSITAQ